AGSSSITSGSTGDLPVCTRVRASNASSAVPKPPGRKTMAWASRTRNSLRVKKYLNEISLGSSAIQGLASCSKGSRMLRPKDRSAPAPSCAEPITPAPPPAHPLRPAPSLRRPTPAGPRAGHYHPAGAGDPLAEREGLLRDRARPRRARRAEHRPPPHGAPPGAHHGTL